MTNSQYTEKELLTTLALVERVNPNLVKGFIAAVLKNMPRSEYLAFVKDIEKLRYRAGV